MDDNRKKKVLCPVEGKDGKVHWMKMGIAFLNKDDSINVYLDCLPTNGKLHLRDWEDERTYASRMGAMRAGAAAAPAPQQEDMPF